MELLQRVHDDGDEGQVELSNVGSDLRVSVARVSIMAAQQGVNSTDGLFMKEENPVCIKKKKVYEYNCCVCAHVLHTCTTLYLILKFKVC